MTKKPGDVRRAVLIDELVEAQPSDVPLERSVSGSDGALLDHDARTETDRIDELYSRLGKLMTRSADEPGLEEVIVRQHAELRQLQMEEANEMRRRFAASLELPPGSGWDALKEARRLLQSDEDSAPTDGSAATRD